MIRHIKPKYACYLFEHDRDLASQEEITIMRSMQFLFLALAHELQMSVVVVSLKGNHVALRRDPEEISSQCKEALDEDLLAQLQKVLHDNNPSTFQVCFTAKQRSENRTYGNHCSIAKNIKKAQKTMSEEEKNNFVGVFLCWLQKFLPHVCLTLQGSLIKPRKKDRLILNTACSYSPFSNCINDFTSPEGEIELSQVVIIIFVQTAYLV